MVLNLKIVQNVDDRFLHQSQFNFPRGSLHRADTNGANCSITSNYLNEDNQRPGAGYFCRALGN